VYGLFARSGPAGQTPIFPLFSATTAELANPKRRIPMLLMLLF
jgi:hypothetical protein